MNWSAMMILTSVLTRVRHGAMALLVAGLSLSLQAAPTVTLTAPAGGAQYAAPATITVSAPGAKLYYLHTDQLDTPRLVTDETNTIVWRHAPLSEPFGLATPEEDPDGDGKAFTMNLRFPGQYADRETNTNYNYFRDYNPELGRYIQSDPIGLRGGINTYTYVGGSPLGYTDPLGLEWQLTIGVSGLIGGHPIPLVPGLFGGGGLSLGVTSSGQFIIQGQATGSAGVGVFAGIGFQGQLSKTKCPTKPGISASQAIQGDANFGAGPSVGGSVQYDVDGGGSFSTGVGKAGVGFGIQASVGATQTVTIATPALFPSAQCVCQ